MQQAGLEELAKAMKISRMGVHKHLTLLQKRGLIESVETRGNECWQTSKDVPIDESEQNHFSKIV